MFSKRNDSVFRVFSLLLAVSLVSAGTGACVSGDEDTDGVTDANSLEELETTEVEGSTGEPSQYGSEGEDSTATTTTGYPSEQSGSGSQGGSSGLVTHGDEDATTGATGGTDGTGDSGGSDGPGEPGEDLPPASCSELHTKPELCDAIPECVAVYASHFVTNQEGPSCQVPSDVYFGCMSAAECLGEKLVICSENDESMDFFAVESGCVPAAYYECMDGLDEGIEPC